MGDKGEGSDDWLIARSSVQFLCKFGEAVRKLDWNSLLKFSSPRDFEG